MATMKKEAVVKFLVNDAESKKGAMNAILEAGLTRFTLDFEKWTVVVIGGIDPNNLVEMLNKFGSTYLVTYGPVKDQGKPKNPHFVQKKAVVKLWVDDAGSKKAAERAIEGLNGITSSFTLDFERWTVVVVGGTDPIELVNKLKKFGRARLDTYEPVMDQGKPKNPDVVQKMEAMKLVANDAKAKKVAKKA